MNLNNYLASGYTQSSICAKIKDDDGVGVTQGAVSLWTKTGAPPKRWRQLERVSNKGMTVSELADEYEVLQKPAA